MNYAIKDIHILNIVNFTSLYIGVCKTYNFPIRDNNSILIMLNRDYLHKSKKGRKLY